MEPNIAAETIPLELTGQAPLAATCETCETCEKRFVPKFHNALESTPCKTPRSGCRYS